MPTSWPQFGQTPTDVHVAEKAPQRNEQTTPSAIAQMETHHDTKVVGGLHVHVSDQTLTPTIVTYTYMYCAYSYKRVR